MPSARQTIVAVALLSAALSGCLGLSGPQANNSTVPPADEAPGPSDDTNRTDAPDGNATDDDGSDDGYGNETTDGDSGNETDGDGSDDDAAQAGWPDPGSARIRPGVAIVDGACTSNFVFSTPDNATLFIGTASHCVSGLSIGDRVSIAGIDGAGVLAYCSFGTEDGTEDCPDRGRVSTSDNDFALVRIRSAHRDQVSPAVLHWGGPTGFAAPGVGDRALVFGNTGLRDAPGVDSLDPREGVVAERSEWMTNVYVAPPSLPGDSGSPAMTADGQAIGSLLGTTTVPAGADSYVNVGRAVGWMESNTYLEVELETWSLLAGGVLP